MTGTQDAYDRTQTLPGPLDAPGVLAAVLRALPRCCAPTGTVTFATPYGDAFTAAVARHATRSAIAPAHHDLAVGDPALETLAAILARPERAGTVYLFVTRGEAPLLECEQTYDWVRFGRAFPATAERCFLAAVHAALGTPGQPAA